MNIEFVNESGRIFLDLTEIYREYTFPDMKIRIEGAIKLNVSESGGHRLFDKFGKCHYIPSGWRHLEWEVIAGTTNFINFKKGK